MTPAVLEERTETQTDLENKLNRFVEEVNAEETLEVDGILYKNERYPKGGPLIEQDSLKILHHTQKLAYLVPIKTILQPNIGVLLEALKTGVFDKVYSVTRIVGYYSRVSNWNKSKQQERRDRNKGNYSVRKVA